MFKAAIFDMDGTLLDSMGVWKDLTRTFMAERNLSATDEEIDSYKDMTMEESMPAIKKKFNLPESVDELKEEFSRLGYNEYMYNIKAKPYAKEYLQKLKEQGIKIAIATSGYRELCQGALRRLGMLEFIDAFSFSSEVNVNKSNPDVYLLAAKRLGAKPEECMVFEDILMGVNGAKRAGMKTTAIYDFTNESDTERLKSTADIYIKTFKELL